MSMRKRSNQFESFIQEGFAEIRKTSGAWLFWINPPVVNIGLKGKMPIFCMTGSALFDLAGWTHADRAAPRMIGVELKESGRFQTSLSIVKRGRQGSGLQHHQIEALAALHRDGHIAGLLWNNGGVIGFCDGETIASAYYNFEVGLRAEEMGKAPTKGAKSIRWEAFSPVHGDKPEDWYLEKVHKEKPAT